MHSKSEFPVVSIIIPCWNAERFVGSAIESALGQTYPNCEVIVVDDGSTDNSLDVIRSFGDRIRWETGPNRGGCAARNRGVALAKGELIQFLDADDELFANKVTEQVKAVQSLSDREVHCVGWEIWSEDGRVHCQVLNEETDSFITILRSNCLISSPLHRKCLLEAVGGFDASLSSCQDFDLHLRLAILGVHFRYDHRSLWRQKRRSGSVSSDDIRLHRNFVRIFERANRLLAAQKSDSPERVRELAASCARSARWLMRRGQKEDGLHALGLARQIHPSGGLDLAYGSWVRLLARTFGPWQAERLAWSLRSSIGRLR